ncbi:MAG: chromate efflux transporter [Anaerolineae bacterium]|nr:chromate efflux transporter [Anaerolineae bacterium]
MSDQVVSYGELIRLFIRLSLTAFGGPVAHIALAEDEVVNRRKWLTREHYLDLIAATNLIPGPNSTEVMIHIGYTVRGIPGALVTGACFIIPAFLLTLVLSIIYVNTGSLPQAQAVFWGIKPVVVAIIANAGWRLLRSALKGVDLWVVFLLSIAAIVLLALPEVVVMLIAGVLYALYKTLAPGMLSLWVLPGLLPLLQVTPEAAKYTPALGEIFLYFLRIGAVLFGSGYLLIAYIQQDLVSTFGWLTPQQLLDALALGQTTPGPVLTTSTAVGYIVAGFPGAVVATLGIFLPSFVFVILTAPLIPRMRNSRWMGAFLSGVNAAVVAAILVTLLDLAEAAIRTPDGSGISPLAIVIAVGALIALIRFKVNTTWLILAGALIGLILA